MLLTYKSPAFFLPLENRKPEKFCTMKNLSVGKRLLKLRCLRGTIFKPRRGAGRNGHSNMSLASHFTPVRFSVALAFRLQNGPRRCWMPDRFIGSRGTRWGPCLGADRSKPTLGAAHAEPRRADTRRRGTCRRFTIFGMLYKTNHQSISEDLLLFHVKTFVFPIGCPCIEKTCLLSTCQY